MVTYFEGLLPIKSFHFLVTWSCKIRLQTKTIIYIYIYIYITTDRFLQVAIGSWPLWDLTPDQWIPFRRSNRLRYQAMSSSGTQSQLCTASRISSLVHYIYIYVYIYILYILYIYIYIYIRYSKYTLYIYIYIYIHKVFKFKMNKYFKNVSVSCLHQFIFLKITFTVLFLQIYSLI